MYKANWILSIFLVCFSAIVALKKPSFISTSGYKYHVSLKQLDFANAFLDCKQRGWTLATEQSQEATDNINAILKGLNAAQNAYWLGGYKHDDDFYEMWSWLDYGTNIMGYTNWYSASNATVGYFCLQKMSNRYNSAWYNAGCNESYLYICESK